MKKRVIIITIVTLALVITGGVIYMLSLDNSDKLKQSISTGQPMQTEQPIPTEKSMQIEQSVPTVQPVQSEEIVPNVNKFSLSDSDNYQYFIDYYNDNIDVFGGIKLLGPVDNEEDALEKALDVWIEIYGEDIKNQKPYSVLYDTNNGIWLVQGSLPKGMLGGVAGILIERLDGKVLAVWHGK